MIKTKQNNHDFGLLDYIDKENNTISVQALKNKNIYLAFTCEKVDNIFHLSLVQPDMSLILNKNKLEDRHAKLISFSKFSHTMNLPLFEKDFLNSKCCLSVPNLETITFHFKIDNSGEILSKSVYFSKSNLKKVYQYQESDEEIKKSKNENSTLIHAYNLANILLKKRQMHNPFILFDLSKKIYTNELGFISQIDENKIFLSFLIFQEFNNLLNHCVSQYFLTKNITAAFQVYNLKEDIFHNSLESLLKECVDDFNKSQKFNQLLKTNINKQKYKSTPSKHWAQQSLAYAPISNLFSRYPSILNQQLFKSAILNSQEITPEKISLLCDHFNYNLKNPIKYNIQKTKAILYNHSDSLIEKLSEKDILLCIQDALLSTQNSIDYLEKIINFHIKTNTLLPSQMYQILIQGKSIPEFKNIHQSLIEYISKTPGLGIQIINIACQSQETWSGYDVIQKTNNNAFETFIYVFIKEKTLRSPITQLLNSKQQSKDEAALDFLKSFLDNQLIEFDKTDNLNKKLNFDLKKNIISEINELCQKKNWSIHCDILSAENINKLPFYFLTLKIKTAEKTYLSVGKSTRKKQAKDLAFKQMKDNFLSELQLLKSNQMTKRTSGKIAKSTIK